MKTLISILAVLFVLSFSMNAMADSNASVDGVGATASNNLDQSVHDNVTTYKATKSHPYSGTVPIPGQPGWFTTPTPDGDFISMKDIIQFGQIYNIGALENMARWGSTRVTYAEVRPEKAASTRHKDDEEIMIIFRPEAVQAVKKSGIHVAFVNGSATNGKTNSVQLMAKMALKALKNGANVIAFQAEGAHRKVESFGWGIGLSYVSASKDNMGTGGTGISGGSVGPEDRPWLQANAFVDAKIQEIINKIPSHMPKTEKK